MTRRLTFLSLTLLLIAGAITLTAATDDDASCAAKRACAKTDTGMRCTVTADGDTDVAKLRECVRSHAAKHHQALDGVTTTFEDVDGGIVVVATGASAEAVQALHARVDSCAGKDHAGCCAAAKHGHHAAADADCCAKASTAAAHEGCAKAPGAATHDGCTKAPAAAATHDGCTKAEKAAHPDCARGTTS